MNKLKMLFQQTTMISTMVLLAIGLKGVVKHIAGYDFIFEWYHPFSIVLTGFLGALPTPLVWYRDYSRKQFLFLLAAHCILLFGVVSLMGFLFHWYSNGRDYLFVAIVYFVIYVLVWTVTFWLERCEEAKINQAIQAIRDEE
ncbi:MAG: DUF3021 domain-containing protein [Acetatifactor sp.]|nr:DUF3021 domain-containing protein [Acetatifactor sp.]